MMSSNIPQKLFLLLCLQCWVFGPALASEVQLTDLSGAVHSGQIDTVLEGSVYLVDGEGAKNKLPLESLTPASQEEVNRWAASNPYFVEVYNEFDEPPSPSRTNNPRNFLDRAMRGETGMVGVEIVINESGEVIFSQVIRSSNDQLNEASLKAVQEWRFNPAKVGGKTVRARLRIPLRY